MESYPATLVQHRRSDGDANGDDGAHGRDDAADDDEIGEEPLPAVVGQDERRMQVRAYNLWTRLLGARSFPRIEDMAAIDMPDFADNAVVLDFSDGIEDPAVTKLGEKLAADCGTQKAIVRLSDVPETSLLSRIIDHYQHIFANQAPVGFEAEFVNRRGKTVVYRGILLPFSSDGEKIRHILGVLNWKELADAAVTAGLIGELDKAAAAPAPVRPPLGEWADGPASGEYVDLDGFPSDFVERAECDLTERLARARELAQAARDAEDRSRAVLYAALGAAWDLALGAEAQPQETGVVATDAALGMPPRGRLAALVGLVFGDAYDEARRRQFAGALAHAQRQGLHAGELASYLAETCGGLEGVATRERQLRRAERGASGPM